MQFETRYDADKQIGAPPGSSSWKRLIWALIPVLLGFFGLVSAAIWMTNESSEQRYRHARQALIEGEREVVLRDAERLLQIPGYEANAYLVRGLLLARSGKLNEALANLHRATAKESLAVEANTVAARCFYESGRYLQAIDRAMIALHDDPRSIDARRWLAAAYYDLGANGPAVQELQRISDEAPNDPGPDRLLGLIAKDGEQFPLAIEHYKKSLARHPLQSELENIQHELAESQIRLGQFQDALETLKHCPRSATSLTLAANCHIGLGHFDEAKSLLHESLKKDPRGYPALLALGKLLLDQGQPDEAIPVLKNAAEVKPQDSQIHFQLAQAFRATGNVESAEEETRRMLEVQAIEREFSDLHLQANNEPNNATIRVRIGELANQLGKPELAKIWYRAALAIDPGNPKAHATQTVPKKTTARESVR